MMKSSNKLINSQRISELRVFKGGKVWGGKSYNNGG